jgi:glycosyltransferase involved in cell wall biosynthesis
MRILLYNWRDLANPKAGGAEVWTEMVARQLVRRGHSVTLFSASVSGHPREETVEGVRVVRRGSRVRVYREARRFWREESGKYDVVIDEINTKPFLTPTFVKHTPIVAIAHQVCREVWFHETHLPIAILGRYVLEPWWLRHYRTVPTLTLSESSAESLRQYGLTNLHVITPGGEPFEPVDVERETTPTIAFLARLVSSKRPDHVVRAFQLLRKTHPETKLWLIGDGPMMGKLQHLHVEGVEFLGRLTRHERDERLARAHVLVATSVREGWGLNVTEAAAYGTPTIGYPVCGLRDSIAMAGGHVVEREDPELLASALAQFFEGKLSLSPRDPTQTWEAVTDGVEAVLSEATALVRP